MPVTCCWTGFSPRSPGRVHDLTAARRHRITATCTPGHPDTVPPRLPGSRWQGAALGLGIVMTARFGGGPARAAPAPGTQETCRPVHDEVKFSVRMLVVLPAVTFDAFPVHRGEAEARQLRDQTRRFDCASTWGRRPRRRLQAAPHSAGYQALPGRRRRVCPVRVCRCADFMAEVEQAPGLMEQLRELGVQLAARSFYSRSELCSGAVPCAWTPTCTWS